MNYQNPISSCSKAPRGLSVLSQVTGIFTGITISPSPSSRQRPDRYAFRAGLNLPDKEFRYLRTVIVTAAVHRGFGSKLRRTEVGNRKSDVGFLLKLAPPVSPLISDLLPLTSDFRSANLSP